MNGDNKFLKEKNEAEYKKGVLELDKRKRAAKKSQAIDDNDLREAQQELEQILKQTAKIAPAKTSTNMNRLITNFAHRKDLNSVFNDFTHSQNISYIRETTARLYTVSFSARKTGKNSLNALKTSINHSARSEKRETLEFYDELSVNNLYFANDRFLTHTDFIKERDTILSFVDDKYIEANNKDDAKHKKAFNKASKYRSSYFNKIKKILPIDNTILPKLLKAFNHWESTEHKLTDLTLAHNKIIVQKARLMILKELKVLKYSEKHIANKIKVFDNYLKHRYEHINLKKSVSNRTIKHKNQPVVTEISFKICHKNGVFNELDDKEVLNAGIAFMKENFPENKIHLGCLHKDEALDINKNTGLNFHLFIDCKANNKNYNWREQYINFAIRSAHINPTIFPELLDIKATEILSNKNMVLVGQAFQYSFYQHLQTKLFNKHKIALKFLSTNERKDFNVINAMLEQDMKLALRQQSRYNAIQEQSQVLEKTNKVLLTKNKQAASTLLKTKVQLNNQTDELNKLKILKDKTLTVILSAIEKWKEDQSSNAVDSTLTQIKLLDDDSKQYDSLYESISEFEKNNHINNNKKLTNKMKKPR